MVKVTGCVLLYYFCPLSLTCLPLAGQEKNNYQKVAVTFKSQKIRRTFNDVIKDAHEHSIWFIM